MPVSKTFPAKTSSLPALALALAMTPGAAEAYIGPGLGAGAIGAVIGVVGSIFLALFAVLYYPIKRMLKKRRKPPTVTRDSVASSEK